MYSVKFSLYLLLHRQWFSALHSVLCNIVHVLKFYKYNILVSVKEIIRVLFYFSFSWNLNFQSSHIIRYSWTFLISYWVFVPKMYNTRGYVYVCFYFNYIVKSFWSRTVDIIEFYYKCFIIYLHSQETYT